ncbi:MAG: hypothetical protein ACF8R7_11640 [Phycisphaerales bacterium JB039]
MPPSQSAIRDTAASRNPLRRAFISFHPSAMPPMARANYRRELAASSLLPFALAVFEGGVLGVLIKNGFEDVASRWSLTTAVALVSAAPAFGNISSFLWVRLWHGQPLARAVASMQAIVAILCAIIAFAPRTEPGMWMMALGAVGARMAWAGALTLRSTAWNQNYSRHYRARLTGKFATIQVLAIGVLGLGMGWAVDHTTGAGAGASNWLAFRILAVIGGAFGLVGAWFWTRVRIRGQRALRRAESGAGADRPSINPASMIRTLAEDRPFAGYMLCMMLLGSGNLMIGAPLVLALRDRFAVDNFGGIAIASSIPYLMMPAMIPLWARLLERTHIIRFRVVHSWVFVAANVLLLLAALAISEALLYASAIIKGFAFAGGALAWNLGHLDFAPAYKASQYMGVHVTLTGVRGLITPFIGVGVYEALEAWRPGTGSWVFALCAGLTIAGGIGFLLLVRRVDSRLQAHPEPVEVAPPSRVG